MEKELRYFLSEVQAQALERAMHNDSRAEVALRCAAIRQLHLGEKPSDVAQHFVVCSTTVYRWWNLYCEGGIEALSNRSKSGRPPKTDAAYWQRLQELIEEDPREHNYVFVVWTTDRLRDHMEVETSISVSAGWLRERMKKLGFVFRRPKKDLRHLQDPQQRDAADEWLKEAKKASATADFELLFVDESTVTQDFSIRACWMKRGQQKRLPAPPGANAFHHVTGALNWRSQQVTYTLAKTKNSETFIEFLEHLLEVAYPQKRIVLVMDNAPWHRSHAVQAVLSLYESQALDDTLEGAIADLDAETRFAVGWFEEQGFQAGDFGRANVLALGKNTAVESVALGGFARRYSFFGGSSGSDRRPRTQPKVSRTEA